MNQAQRLNLLTPAEADVITQAWVDAHVDFDRAAREHERYPCRTEEEKLTLSGYTPGYEWLWEPDGLGTIWRLVKVPRRDCPPGEPDWERALRLETTQQYIQWFREGLRPPPIYVVQTQTGKLSSLNRRRWLAAREAGIEEMLAWYSPTVKGELAPAWERKLCTWDRSRVCTTYAEGGDCETCSYRHLYLND